MCGEWVRKNCVPLLHRTNGSTRRPPSPRLDCWMIPGTSESLGFDWTWRDRILGSPGSPGLGWTSVGPCVDSRSENRQRAYNTLMICCGRGFESRAVPRFVAAVYDWRRRNGSRCGVNTAHFVLVQVTPSHGIYRLSSDCHPHVIRLSSACHLCHLAFPSALGITV